MIKNRIVFVMSSRGMILLATAVLLGLISVAISTIALIVAFRAVNEIQHWFGG